MKKRLLSLLLASVMIVSVCACGNEVKESNVVSTNSTEKESTVSSETSNAVVEDYVPKYPIVDEKITITGLVVGQDVSVSNTRILWDELEEITNIHIEWENIDQEAFGTRLASGNWPDLIASDMGQTAINDYGILGGKLVNYLDYIDIMPNLKKTFEDYPHTLAYATQLDGGVYNLFRVQGAVSTGTTHKAHYRIDLLEEAGITEEPRTIEEFYDCLVAFKEHFGVPGYIHQKSMTQSYNPSIFGAFGTLTQMDFSDDGTGTVVFSRTTEQMKLYYKFMHKLYEEELMHREYLTLDNNAVLKLVESGQAAFFPQAAASKLTASVFKDGDISYLGTLYPFTSEYDDTMEVIGYSDYDASHGMHINAESEYVEEICKMLDICFATEEVVEGSNISGVNFSKGPEGVTWRLNDDGATYTEIIPEGYKSNSAYLRQVYEWNYVGRSDVTAGRITDTPGNSQQRQLGYVEKAIPYLSKNFVNVSQMKFTDDEQYVIENKYGEIQTYYNQMEAEFISGTSDIDEKWDEYVKTLEAMGAAEVTAVYQAAYDRLNEAMAALSK